MDNVKAIINTELSFIPLKFGDLALAESQRSRFEERIGFKVEDLLSKQKNADYCKKVLGKKDFYLCLSLYFHQFDSKQGFKAKDLLKDIKAKEQVYRRHLGKDKVSFMELLCRLGEAMNERPALKIVPQGLLFREAP